MAKTIEMTRRERRAQRQQRFVTEKEARLAARLARLDYRLSGETGVLRLPAKGQTWCQGNRKNGQAPSPGRGWDRSGPTYVVESAELGKLPKPIIHHSWRRLMVEE